MSETLPFPPPIDLRPIDSPRRGELSDKSPPPIGLRPIDSPRRGELSDKSPPPIGLRPIDSPQRGELSDKSPPPIGLRPIDSPQRGELSSPKSSDTVPTGGARDSGVAPLDHSPLWGESASGASWWGASEASSSDGMNPPHQSTFSRLTPPPGESDPTNRRSQTTLREVSSDD